MNDLPIACALSPTDQARRFATSTAIVESSLLDATLTERGASMRFRPTAESGLRELIAAESECCAFLEFALRRDGEDLRLTVEGPEMARPIIVELFGLDVARV